MSFSHLTQYTFSVLGTFYDPRKIKQLDFGPFVFYTSGNRG